MARSFAGAVRLAMRPGGPSLGARIAALPRMVRATLSGQYPSVSVGQLLMLAAAVGYVISPVDILPELVFGPLGLVDDAFVVSWLAKELITDTEDFLAWEKGAAGPSSAGRQQPPDGPVRSHVVK